MGKELGQDMTAPTRVQNKIDTVLYSPSVQNRHYRPHKLPIGIPRNTTAQNVSEGEHHKLPVILHFQNIGATRLSERPDYAHRA